MDGTVGDAIGSFSEQTQAFFAAWQNGEATQKQVIDSIVSDIANCTNQQEALNLAATAFGTMAEDGSLKFITALTSMGDAYDDVSDAANGMFDQTLTSTEELESNTRKVQQALVPLGERITSLANTVLPPLTAAIQTVSEWFSSMPEPIQNFVVILGVLLAAFTALTPVIAAVAVSVSALNISLLPVIGVIAAVAAAIAAIIAIVVALVEMFTVSDDCPSGAASVPDGGRCHRAGHRGVKVILHRPVAAHPVRLGHHLQCSPNRCDADCVHLGSGGSNHHLALPVYMGKL